MDGSLPAHAPSNGMGSTSTNELFSAEGSSLIFPERTGNAIHLATVVRKFTNARPTHAAGRSFVKVETVQLYDALGLFRALKYDVSLYNEAMLLAPPPADAGDGALRAYRARVRIGCFRLLQQASAFGARLGSVAENRAVDVPGLDALIARIESDFGAQLAHSRALVRDGVVDFDALAELFTPGRELVERGVATGLHGVATGFLVRACYFTRCKTLFGEGRTFYAALECVVSVGASFALVEAQHAVGHFSQQRSISSGGASDFCLLGEAHKAQLDARGRLYERIACAPTLVQHSGPAFLPLAPPGGSHRAPPPRAVAGRAMIDTSAALGRGVHVGRMAGSASEAITGALKTLVHRARGAGGASAEPEGDEPRAEGGGGGGARPPSDEAGLELGLLLLEVLPPELHWRTWPTVAGFSFGCKRWGVAVVDGLGDVRFDASAFERLVLPAPRKRLIQALVLHAAAKGGAGAGAGGRGAAKGADLIAGKGEGAVFLLHGPPGVGKTLTAEAIAEMLGRPLYSVSMGELGTTPESLERTLQDVFELAAPWGCLVLIDEAEMLIERRSPEALVRNAMVCVMLRLVEYHPGILFLTCNRVRSVDPAFHSRVQCALQYDALDAHARTQVWRSLLAAVGADIEALRLEPERLGVHPLNGRQIKNALQLGLALSRRDEQPLSQQHLEETVAITLDFALHSETGGHRGAPDGDGGRLAAAAEGAEAGDDFVPLLSRVAPGPSSVAPAAPLVGRRAAAAGTQSEAARRGGDGGGVTLSSPAACIWMCAIS